jgi:hypothetical protein
MLAQKAVSCPGLTRGIHTTAQRKGSYDLCLLFPLMDCRVKPGNDNGESCAYKFAFAVRPHGRITTPAKRILRLYAAAAVLVRPPASADN